jgi:fatty acid desaturase
LHHNHLYGKEDPDIALHGGYPRGRWYLIKKLARDLCGLTAWKTYGYFFGNPAINDDRGAALRPLDDTSSALRHAARRDRAVVIAVQIALPVAAFAAGYGMQYLVLWVLPALTGLQAILRLRAILEHGAVRDLSSPLTAARTNLASAPVLWLLFPHHVNYHIEHHLYPAIPHYNLPEAHRLLLAAGALENSEVANVSVGLGKIFAESKPQPEAA